MSSLDSLTHIHKTTPTWADVYVLDTWAIIDSEADAMLQALHSRSTWGLMHHLEILKEKWADNFMSKFYVGYGHKSIWDCGSITLFIEWVSMLAAKAIQDTKLYNGQEASTRYIDFSKQPLINPAWSDLGEEILEEQRSLYLEILPHIIEHLKEQYPHDWSVSEKMYLKTIKAKAFDIARWFLPAWCSTNLARHTTLRQVADRISTLRHHPLREVQEIAQTLLEAVLEAYPNSFSKKTYEATESYIAHSNTHYYYHAPNDTKTCELVHNAIHTQTLETYREILTMRPNNKTEFPTYIDHIWTMTFRYLLDFWSFRDIQRHRAPYQRMPLLTQELWCNTRYIDSLPVSLQSRVQHHLSHITKKIDALGIWRTEAQYYIPMWYNMSCEIMGTLPALIYMVELRSTTYVHPTLRQIAITMWSTIRDTLDIPVFLDTSDDEFDTRRGKQDIELK